MSEREDLENARSLGAAFGADVVARIRTDSRHRGSLFDDEGPQDVRAYLGLHGCQVIAETAESKRCEGLSDAAVQVWTEGALKAFDEALSRIGR